MRATGNVLTFGGAWAVLFENSLSRKMAQLEHLDLGNPSFQLSFEKFIFLTGSPEIPETKELYDRLTKNTVQASELLFKFGWYINHAHILFIDNQLLDTAIGHHLLILADQCNLPTYGVGVNQANSPLAPAFLKGILYPATPDDLVAVALQHLKHEIKNSLEKTDYDESSVF